MSEPHVGEIRLFAGNFAPRGWEFCRGQLLSIAQNSALFSLLGNSYGGNGQTSFALPDLRGRVPIHQGQGPGLSDRRLGGAGGVEHVQLNATQMPAHTHPVPASTTTATSRTAVGNVPALLPGNGMAYSTAEANETVDRTSLAAGAGQPHTNLQPHVAINYIIAVEGVFPSRS